MPFNGSEGLPDLVDRCLRVAVGPLLTLISSRPDITHETAGRWSEAVEKRVFRWSEEQPSRRVRDHPKDPYILTRWLCDTWNRDGGWTTLIDAGITHDDVRDLFRLRNGHAHNQYESGDAPLEASDVRDGLGNLCRILDAIGAPEEAKYVRSAQDIAGGKAKGSAKRKQWLDLRSDEPRGVTHTVGLHWTEPAPDSLKPEAWWLVDLDADGVLKSPVTPQSTDEVLAYLGRFQEAGESVLLGCAFCFSVPKWLGDRLASESGIPAPDVLWRAADRCAEPAANAAELIESINAELDAGPGPFWRGDLNEVDPISASRHPGMRATEKAVQKQTEARPSSVFRVGGDASVGALALWGMAILPWLRESGFAIWPFDDPGPRTAVEIFPRSLWSATNPGRPVRSRQSDREAFFDGRASVGLGGATRDVFVKERRAFDALLTAWSLRRYGGNIARSPDGSSPAAAVEGEIWLPTPNSKRDA